jgi:hypothetical protein
MGAAARLVVFGSSCLKLKERVSQQMQFKQIGRTGDLGVWGRNARAGALSVMGSGGGRRFGERVGMGGRPAMPVRSIAAAADARLDDAARRRADGACTAGALAAALARWLDELYDIRVCLAAISGKRFWSSRHSSLYMAKAGRSCSGRTGDSSGMTVDGELRTTVVLCCRQVSLCSRSMAASNTYFSGGVLAHCDPPVKGRVVRRVWCLHMGARR